MPPRDLCQERSILTDTNRYNFSVWKSEPFMGIGVRASVPLNDPLLLSGGPLRRTFCVGGRQSSANPLILDVKYCWLPCSEAIAKALLFYQEKSGSRTWREEVPSMTVLSMTVLSINIPSMHVQIKRSLGHRELGAEHRVHRRF